MSGNLDTARGMLAMLSPAERARLVQECATPAPVENRIVRRVDTARMLARSTRAVDYLVQSGALSRVTFPGHKRAAGFRYSDIQALIAGAA